MTSSLAEASAPMGTTSSVPPTRASPPEDAVAAVAAVSASPAAQEPKNEPSQARVSRPRAAAAAANASMAEQVKQEDESISVTLAKVLGGQEALKPATSDTHDVNTRPSHAKQVKEEQEAVGVSSVAITSSCVEDEEFPVKKRTAEDVPGPAAKRSKVSAAAWSKQVPQNTLENASAEQPSRGKKRRQAAVFEAAPIITDVPPLPFTTSSPELKVKNKGKLKSKLQGKSKSKVSDLEGKGDKERTCEFCKKVTNICVQMHCHGCRRVYHPGCFVNAFKPFVDTKVPILEQMGRLQLEAPERRGNIFRCNSCKAAFLDFYESGGYLWDCDCPTCSQPAKIIYYRQRKLVQMMNDMELERQRKKDQKAKKHTPGNPPAPAPTSTCSNSTSRSRRSRGSRAKPDEKVLSAQTTQRSTSRGVSPSGEMLKQEMDAVKAEALSVVNDRVSGSTDAVTKVEPMQVDGSGEHLAEPTTSKTHGPFSNNLVKQQQTSEMQQQTDLKAVKQERSNAKITEDFEAEGKQVAGLLHKLEMRDESGSDAAEIQPTELEPPEKQHSLPNLVSGERLIPQLQENSVQTVVHEPIAGPEQLELLGDDLVGAVQVVRDDKTGGWCFPVMCSRTSSLRESGVMKTGKCKWLPKKAPVVQCDCCDKFLFDSEFVHHTDNSLVKDPKCASQDPMPFLFVQHRDTTQHTPLEKFLPALRKWSQRQNASNTPTKTLRSHVEKQDSLSAIVLNPEAVAGESLSAPARLRALALFKRPKHRGDRSSIVSRLSDPASFEFVAQVVCLSPSYVMSMADGRLADRVIRSQTPAPGDSFPRKSGWLAFSRSSGTSRHITCACCGQAFTYDEFVEHAGISLSELKIKSRQLLYIVERQDESALVPYKTFILDLEFVKKNHLFLDDLHPPPSSATARR